ncbi:hypothetical protein CcaCcLH18_06471 [Colletotrichum camelliae]|nr:hypothetical protein CcaCcLH18_06471 [Colletotrichum camelliae]
MSRQPLQHARRPIYILIVYLLLLLGPWICICVVNQRTTSDPWGILMRDDFDKYSRWMRVAPFLSAVTAVIALPCVAALLAHGAVVFSQRRSHRQALSLRQLFALSDIQWTAVFSKGQTSSYLMIATALLLLVAAQLPLQSLLMPMSARVVYLCDSSQHLTKWDRTCDGEMYRAKRVGIEPEPALLRVSTDFPNIISPVRSKLASITSADVQENLWRDGNTDRSFVTGSDQKYDAAFWVSSVPAGTTTGPLRQHSMRFNSTADCQVATREDFPSDCVGYSTTLEGFGVIIKVCMPDDSKNPEVERAPLPPRRRQDIDEVVFIDAQISPEALQASDFVSDPAENVTLKCTAKTTRAFFELGNFYTKLNQSGIVDEWPSDEVMKAQYHDYNWSGNLITSESDQEWDRDVFGGWTSSMGPLRTTVEALFGAESYPQAVLAFLSQTFPDGQMPANLSLTDDSVHDATKKGCALPAPLHGWQMPYNSKNDDFDTWYPSIYNGCTLNKLPKSLFRIAQGLRHLTVAQSTLGVGMFLSNAAVLQDAASNDAARTIYNLTGTAFVAPKYSLGATVMLSALIALQTICLALLVWYICTLPTWTNTLDSFAMFRAGSQLKDSVNLPLGHVDQDVMHKFNEIDGLVGAVPGPGITMDDDLEMATMTSSNCLVRSASSTQQYEIIRPSSPASSVSSASSVDMPAVPPQARQAPDGTYPGGVPGMSAADLSSYLQGGGLATPVSPVSSVASSVRSASPPPPYLPTNSSNREQRTRSPYELGLGAPGLITKALWSRNQPK